MRETDLRGADLTDADLSDTQLCGDRLAGAKVTCQEFWSQLAEQQRKPHAFEDLVRKWEVIANSNLYGRPTYVLREQPGTSVYGQV